MPRKPKPPKDPERDAMERAMFVAKSRWIEAPSLTRDQRYVEYLEAKRLFEERYPPPPLLGKR